MPFPDEEIAGIKSLSDDWELENQILSLKMLMEEGLISQEEADQRLKNFKRGRGFNQGGEVSEMSQGDKEFLASLGLTAASYPLLKSLINKKGLLNKALFNPDFDLRGREVPDYKVDFKPISKKQMYKNAFKRGLGALAKAPSGLISFLSYLLSASPAGEGEELEEFYNKRNSRVDNKKDGGEIKDGIATFIPHMKKGGILNSFNEIMQALIFVESNGNPNAVSPAGAIGLTQVKVPTAMQPGNKVENIFQIARKNGVDFSGETEEEARRLLFIPSLNVQFGEQYLKAMIRRFGNVRDGITAYNQGPKTFTEFLESGRDPNVLSKEGREYLPKVLQAIGVEDFGFSSIPPVPEEDRKTLGSVFPEKFNSLGQEFLKSDDQIQPVYIKEIEARPTELVDKLGLPGDLLREAEMDKQEAQNPDFFSRAQMPLERPEVLEEDVTLTSSVLPPRRPSQLN